MVLVLQERVACYAHTWHLTATALHLSLLIAEPSLTLPFPASFSRLKQALHVSRQRPAHKQYPMIVSSSLGLHSSFLGYVYFWYCLLLPSISPFNNEAVPCLHVQNIALLHMNRPLICCLHPNTCK